LTLSYNPVAKEATYTKVVQEVLPQLKYLDEDYISATIWEHDYRIKES